MFWLYYFHPRVELSTTACVGECTVQTLAKANMSVDLVESKPYTWTNCEERHWDIGKERVSMTRANSVITLGESEVHA